MAEAFAVVGLVAAIGQFVEFGAKVVERLNEFASDTENLPKTFRGIRTQIPLLINTVERTQKQAENGILNEATSDSLRPLIDGCLEQVKLLKDILDSTVPSGKASNWQRRVHAIKSLAQDKKIDQITTALERYVQLLVFHQTTTNLDLSSRPLDGAGYQSSNQANALYEPLFMVPFHRDDGFVGREEVLTEIKGKFNTRQRRAAVAGMGGVGKSQIAIEYCYRYKTEHPEAHVFWVHSSSLTRFDQAYTEIARKLNLNGLDDPNTDVLHIVMEWLSRDSIGPWLMVIDNADDQEAFFNPSSQSHGQGGQRRSRALANYLPRSSSGSILITTRNKQVGYRLADGVMPMIVSPLLAEDARKLLRAKLPDEDDWSEKESMQLLESLHYLPLAISQAAAYICEEQVTVARYLGLLKDDLDTKDVLEQNYYDSARDSEIQNSVFSTWKISFNQIKRDNPRAAEILSLMAMLDRQSISEKLLVNKDERKVSFDKAMGTLKAFSLITEERKGAVFGMHRLVQISIQQWLKEQQLSLKWQEAAMSTVCRCSPSSADYKNWPQWEIVFPHIRAVLDFDTTTESFTLDRASLLTKAAEYDEQRGRGGPAREKVEEAVTIRQRIFGVEHPDTLTSMHVMAIVQDHQGKFDDAERTYRRVLELRDQTLGKQHTDTLTTMTNLASVLDSRASYEEAERMHRRVLETRQRLLGKEHPSTLTSMNSLGLVLRSQGKYEEAEGIHREEFGLREMVLGRDHPQTLTSMNNLANVLMSQGKDEQAQGMHRQALELRTSILGVEHPDTLTSMNNLAQVLKSLCKYDEAEEVYQRQLALSKRVLGKEHPTTLISMNNLALLFKSQEKYGAAEDLQRQVLRAKERRLGRMHPSTLISMNNLARILEAQGKKEEAVEMHQQVLEARMEVLGEDHPHTLNSKINLAHTLEMRSSP